MEPIRPEECIRECLMERRTISVKNLQLRTGFDLDRLTAALETLQKEESVRLARGRGCHCDTLSCSGCTQAQTSSLTGEEIVVSKIINRRDEHVDW